MSQPAATETNGIETNGVEVILSDGTVARWGNLTDAAADQILAQIATLVGEPDTIAC